MIQDLQNEFDDNEGKNPNAFDLDVYLENMKEINQTIIDLSIANQVLSTKTAFICTVKEADDIMNSQMTDLK